MKIESIELIRINMPFKQKFAISSGAMTEKEFIIVKVHSEGLVGIGQAAPMPGPFYSAETPGTCYHIIEDFIVPKLLGLDIEDISDANDIFSSIRGNNIAKASIEVALWDLLAKRENMALYKYIGGEDKEIKWKISFSIMDSVEKLIGSIENHVKKGLKSIKLKITQDWDIIPVKAVREHFGDIELMVDANSCYSPEDEDLFLELDKYKLVQIEQPFSYDDLYDHYTLQKKLNTPICLDESIRSVVAAKNALDMESCRVINIKVQRVGGIANTIKIHDMCMEAGVPVWIGSMRESGVGNTVNLAMCSLPNVTMASNIDSPGSYFTEDIVTPDIEFSKNGNMLLLKDPGIGVELRQDMMEKFTVDSMIVGKKLL